MERAARRIVEKLRLHGHEAFFAGGWVRDHLLRRKATDIDIATSALPEEVQRLFPNATAIGAKFGVIQVRHYGRSYEVATFRSDNAYVDGRHPSSVSFSGPRQDALRRDFTINGLFYDPVADRVIDYVQGRRDIKTKVIRTIGNPEDRFAEDKLRMLRAVRLASNLDFAVAPETWGAIKKLAPDILQVSWERIRDELFKLLTGENPGKGLDLLHESGLLKHILPEVESMCGVPYSKDSREMDVFAHTRTALSLLRRPSSILALGTLLHDVGKTLSPPGDAQERFKDHEKLGAEISEAVCRRIRMSNEAAARVVDLVRTHMEFSRVHDMRESAFRRFLRKPDFADHLELYRVNRLSVGGDLKTYEYCLEKYREYAREPAAPPLLTGDDLVLLGHKPGPAFQEMLRAIEDLQLEGVLRTREEALEYIRAHYPPADAGGP